MKLHVSALKDPLQAKCDEICRSKKIKEEAIYFYIFYALVCINFVTPVLMMVT